MQHISFAFIFVWVRKLDSDSLTETKNWSGRNEVIETSSRLHHLWPQNKRLRTPWITDWMHTGQDRWIQTELVFTLAKNATKPNPFKIISLQTTRKENSWETEETMERATVTLETERAKWPNPGCLWWYTENQCWTDSSVTNTTISRTWRDRTVEGSNKNVHSCTMYSSFNSVSLMMG